MFKAIFTNSFGILFSRLLGFIRDLLTASVLGANIYSDIFFVAFKLPNLFRRIFAEGAFTQTFIPSFTRSRHKGIFALYIFFVFASITVILTLLVNLLPELATKAIAVGFDKQTVQLASIYVGINFWYLPLIFSVTFIAALLQYKHHFATTAFATSLLNISLISALLLARGEAEERVVLYMSYGVVIGGILQLLVHLAALWKIGLCRLLAASARRFWQRKELIQPEVKKFKSEFIPAIWGNSTAQLSAFLDTWLASFLATGTISYLYYANRVFQLPLALFAIATSVALFPKVSRYLKNAQEQEAMNYLRKGFWLLVYLLGLSTLGGIILAQEITTLLFERGAFDATDTHNTALILQMYMGGLLAFGLSKLFSLWLYAQQRQRQAAKIASLSLGSNIVLSLLLIYPFGGAGLALASTLSGYVGLFFTLKAFGVQRFLVLLQSRHLLLFSAAAAILAIILLIFKELLHRFM